MFNNILRYLIQSFIYGCIMYNVIMYHHMGIVFYLYRIEFMLYEMYQYLIIT